ncbi:Cobalamin (Vitamin B12) biosynthesis CbiM protein [[Clostridium] ultunense Esp]|uniref:energy-coupling factor ABC transporter permease n=1 Tax=Thermicanus aegyptius TaxID=94009 RepID=UPI0002B6FD55|nr:energy-coupling factor ABC transporter permease [Thermicanus aegyptius]CCQ96319.1 Cobalamin (Vitamin B12) biosynthesis CbiM protein [[Clostridium] ultunense Esp]
MHIPDGILSPAVLAGSALISATVVGYGFRWAKKKLEPPMIPTMGVMAAFLFAAQMINFPLLGAAASGHLLGGTLAAILFGFWPATLIMTTVVTIQALFFQDGGITALGLNLLDMAVIAPAVSLGIYRLLERISLPTSVRAFISAWTSVVAAALMAAFALGLSGVVSYGVAFSSLLLWHSLIGIGEGIITAVILPFASRSSLQLLPQKLRIDAGKESEVGHS